MKKQTGKDVFESYYKQLFKSHGEFEAFLSALQSPSLPTLRFDPENEKLLRSLWEKAGLTWKPVSWFPLAIFWPKEAELGTLLPGYADHLFYPMNISSYLPLLALDLKPSDIVLDACAAPGGKTLAMRQYIDSAHGHLVANELSTERFKRMKKIFKDYKAPDIETAHMPAETIHLDAPEMFDKILLDAPCSSEKHTYSNQSELSGWSEMRIKKLRQRQYKLVDKLLKALKPGGRLVYSTCAVTPAENEGVIARILKNRSEIVQLADIDWRNLPGRPGFVGDYSPLYDLSKVRRILPDSASNFDPMFVAAFDKK